MKRERVTVKGKSAMNNGKCIVLILSVGMLLLSGLSSQQVNAETLKVVKDQLELRDAPKATEETVLGTLRINTPVEWTGNISGGWFEIKAPNGQIGWVHGSGISKPATRPQPSPKPTSAPVQEKTRKVVQPPSSRVAEPKSSATQLQKTNEQYKALLEEKDRRIGELTKELDTLEKKWSDTAQTVDDTAQQRQMEQNNLSDIQQEIEGLKKALKEKEEALLTEQVNASKLQNQLANLQSQQEQKTQTSSLEWWLLYAVSIPINLIVIIGLAIIGLRYQKTKQQESEKLVEESPKMESFDSASDEWDQHLGKILSSTNDVTYSYSSEHIREDVPVVSTTEPAQDTISAEEEVVVDLDDVLSEEHSADVEKPEKEEEEEIEIVFEEEIDEIIEMPEERPGNAPILSEYPPVSEETISDSYQSELLENEEALENIEEEIELILDDTDEKALPEELDEFLGDTLQRVENIEDDDIQEFPLETMSEEAIIRKQAEIEKQVEELLADLPMPIVKQKVKIDESPIEPEEEGIANVEIDGEQFEILPERSTQIIEPAEETELPVSDYVEEPIPTLLEPSPILIEPEYEPEEPASAEKQIRAVPPMPEKTKYDIEFVSVGENKARIIQLLSKIEGLTNLPEELVKTIPSIIARGANENDARNFQIVMKKLGADVRLIQR